MMYAAATAQRATGFAYYRRARVRWAKNLSCTGVQSALRRFSSAPCTAACRCTTGPQQRSIKTLRY
jgi:hypothetical protein